MILCFTLFGAGLRLTNPTRKKEKPQSGGQSESQVALEVLGSRTAVSVR